MIWFDYTETWFGYKKVWFDYTMKSLDYKNTWFDYNDDIDLTIKVHTLTIHRYVLTMYVLVACKDNSRVNVLFTRTNGQTGYVLFTGNLHDLYSYYR